MTSPGHKHRIVPLEVGRRQPYRKWKIKDLEFLQLMYPVTSRTAIAKEMGISEASVRNAIVRFKIKKKP